MKKLLLASFIAIASSVGALAQTATTSPMPSPKGDADKNAPLPGANSFTESQAKSRLEANGYSQIGPLTKDADGVWKGSATHGGATVNVTVDYRGNITRK
ncbi:PepSY domain-containing protein [Bosea sp. 2KB_26]|uniref:PepSY domain-containing protein n=1 Tax=Bosea sp. 2KB_26 TaxID=3237475 RepID=UPI003F918DA1